MVERIYTIPLRREFLKSPKWRHSEKAIRTIKLYLQKHTKVKDVRLSRWINEAVWANGSKNTPGKISLKVDIDKDKGIAKAELVELPKKAKRLTEAQKKAQEKAKKAESKKPKEESAEEKKEEAKEAEKTPATMTPQQEMALHKK